MISSRLSRTKIFEGNCPSFSVSISSCGCIGSGEEHGGGGQEDSEGGHGEEHSVGRQGDIAGGLGEEHRMQGGRKFQNVFIIVTFCDKHWFFLKVQNHSFKCQYNESVTSQCLEELWGLGELFKIFYFFRYYDTSMLNAGHPCQEGAGGEKLQQRNQMKEVYVEATCQV